MVRPGTAGVLVEPRAREGKEEEGSALLALDAELAVKVTAFGLGTESRLKRHDLVPREFECQGQSKDSSRRCILERFDLHTPMGGLMEVTLCGSQEIEKAISLGDSTPSRRGVQGVGLRLAPCQIEGT